MKKKGFKLCPEMNEEDILKEMDEIKERMKRIEEFFELINPILDTLSHGLGDEN